MIRFWKAFGIFLCIISGHSILHGATIDVNPEHFAFRIQSATLTSPLGERTVTLPYVLENDEFDANGSRVRFRINVNLPKAPKQAIGIFINKLSLAGAVYLNGQLVDQCADGDMTRLRCLHRPLLFKPATQLWHAGNNILEIEVHGNDGQVNGLSEVLVGDAHLLYREVYLPQFGWRITLNEWLGFAIVALGTLSLAVGVSLREESVYRWYGLTCLLLAASLSNLIADQLPFSMRFWNWLIITSRLFAAHMFLLTCLHLFNKHRPWHTRWTLVYALFFAIGFYVFNVKRTLVTAAYLPMLLITPVLIVFMVRWSVQSGNSRHILTCSLMILLFLLGARDWVMFDGQGRFEFVYLMPLGFTASILFVGFLLTSQLITSLRTARELSIDLETKVTARTKELKSALDTIEQLEQTTLKLTEAIPVGTYVLEVPKDGNAFFSFLSKRWLEMLDLTQEAVAADSAIALRCIHPDDYANLRDKHYEVFQHPQVLTWEGRALIRGEVRWLSIEAAPRLLDKGRILFEGVVVDVTIYKETLLALNLAHEQLTEAAVQQSKITEREQLLIEMHDGFGSNLAIARLIAESGEASLTDVSVILQECVADLYLVIDTLSSPDNTFLDSLVDMRSRMDRRTVYFPVDLIWKIDIDVSPNLSQHTILQLLRIIAESVNNALKHSQATHIRISVTQDLVASQLLISVADNGVGLPDKLVKGRGLHNMDKRARLLGATLMISPNEPGVCVLLTLPLPMP